MKLNKAELKEFLDEMVDKYNTIDFIEKDPIQIPHLYTIKEDIEIAGFLSASIAWGNRTMIISNSKKMMKLLGNSPFDFVMSHKKNDLERLNDFVHRTFNGQDFKVFVRGLKNIYTQHNGLESIFVKHQEADSMQKSISEFKKIFFDIEHSTRTEKHIADPLNGSAGKRINMWLRWNCRQDKKGVDLGIWKDISPSKLSCPLDVHSGNVARKLGLLTRKQNDAKAVIELDANLRLFDKNDPVKYDFALFGLGVFEKF